MNKFLKSFFLICLGGFLGVGGVLFLLFIAIISLSSNPLQVKEDSWLMLNFTGEIVERPLSEYSSLFGRNMTKMELMEYVKSIEMASEDSRIKGILINGDLARYNRVHVEEIVKALTEFKTTGKKVYAWFSQGDNRSYMLTSVADKVYMPDTKSAFLSLSGYSITMPYFKEGLDRMGVDFSVIHIGDFKGAGENYVKNRMSAELEQSYRTVFDDLYNKELSFVAERRGVEAAQLDALIAAGKAVFMEPDQALEMGLIDGKYSLRELKRQLAPEGFNSVSIINYCTLLSKRSKATDKVALVYADGSITNYFSYDGDSFRGPMTGAKTFVKDIEQIKADSSIKAVVLRVNSPGGSALASELMLQALLELQKVKPLYVSMGPVAASGGYYISMGGKKVFASPFTITGSIGVVSMHMEYEELAQKLGVNFETIKKHDFDDFFSSVRELSNSEAEILRRSMTGIYEEFTGHVVEQRGIERELIGSIAEGRIWSGEQARGHRLVDEQGGLLDVIRYAVKESDLSSYSIVSYPKPYSFFEKFRGASDAKIGISLEDSLKAELLSNSPELKSLADSYYFYRENGSLPAYYVPFLAQ